MASRRLPGEGDTRRGRTGDVRGALIDSAARVLERDGTAGLTVRAVAADAGVAPMGVYNHLHGKDGLLTAVLARGFHLLAAAVAFRTDLPAAHALWHAGQAYRTFALDHPVTYSLMFGGARTTTPTGTAPREGSDAVPDDDLGAELAAAGERAFGCLVTAMHAGQAAGTIRDGDPVGLARTVWSCIHGAVSLELAAGTDRTEGAGMYAAVQELVVRGIAPGPHR